MWIDCSRTPRGSHPYDVLFGPWSLGVAATVLAGAWVLVALGGPSRLGIELCWLKHLSRLPCPGCGMTRSVYHLVQGHWAEALRLQPFSFLLVPYALLTVSSPLWTESSRLRLRYWLGRRRRGFAIIYGGVVGAFIAFGLLRALAVSAGLVAWS